jgi:hypothetical protein
MANKFFTSIKARYFNTAADTAVDVGVDGDSNSRLAIDAGGRITWGDGSSNGDIYIQRSTSSEIQVSGTLDATVLKINNTYTFANSDGTSNQVIATDGSGNLYWSSAPSDNAILQWVGL